jgi:betaine reductase
LKTREKIKDREGYWIWVSIYRAKKVLALGERDGIQGAAIAQCASSAGAKVVLEMTHCFV